MLAHPHFRCPGYACNEYKVPPLVPTCPKVEGPYKKESVEQFGISLGNVDEFTIDCPLQDAVEILDGLKVSRITDTLTVRWCHMHINRDIKGALEPKTRDECQIVEKTCRYRSIQCSTGCKLVFLRNDPKAKF